MEKTIKQNIVYKGKILDLYNDDVLCDNGSLAKREIVHHHGGAGILAVKDDKVLLVKQYRYAYEKDLLEIPAGKLELGEDPKETALRELEEEAALKADDCISLGILYPTCGYSNEVIHLYYADSFIVTHTNFDPNEDITSSWYSIDDCLKMIDEGQICDAKTIVAIYKYVLKHR